MADLFPGELAAGRLYPMRGPCRFCAASGITHVEGRLIPKNGQNCVYCSKCNRLVYNAPKLETGEPQRSVRSRPDVAPSLRARILGLDNYRCHLCGRAAPDVILHVSHLLSVEDGREQGATDDELWSEENLATFCEECNLGMGHVSAPARLLLRLIRARRTRVGA